MSWAGADEGEGRGEWGDSIIFLLEFRNKTIPENFSFSEFYEDFLPENMPQSFIIHAGKASMSKIHHESLHKTL